MTTPKLKQKPIQALLSTLSSEYVSVGWWSQELATLDSSGARRYLLEETALQNDVLDMAARMMLENDHDTDSQ